MKAQLVALLATLGCLVSVAACTEAPANVKQASMQNVIPAPSSVRPAEGTSFTLSDATTILTWPGSAEAARIGADLAKLLRRSTGYPLPVSAGDDATPPHSISLQLAPSDRRPDEGYELVVEATSVALRANTPEGLFRAVQTLRQLLPATVESATKKPGPWQIPGGRILDQPRFAWRGVSLDVARHFFTVSDVKRYLDAISLYKINVLHLHLTDDQGWRLAIKNWPKLTTYGGSKEVGGGSGGFYTQQQYAEIVAYAQDRYVTVVPEIDMPGHTNAALASYPELNCDGTAPPLYTGTDVGFSSLCVDKDVTYRFLDDVIGEVAALTPGPYLHIGGDEVKTLDKSQYTAFIERVEKIVRAHGKKTIGWQEIAQATKLPPATTAQYWDTGTGPAVIQAAAKRGLKFVLSPADHAYLDMKYDKGTPLGLDWAGLVEVRDAYEWDPSTLIAGITDADLVGVEAPIWTETLTTMDEIEYMTFPRLPAIAEIGWSAADQRNWPDFRQRLAAHGPRWSAMGVNYHRSSQIPWPA